MRRTEALAFQMMLLSALGTMPRWMGEECRLAIPDPYKRSRKCRSGSHPAKKRRMPRHGLKLSYAEIRQTERKHGIPSRNINYRDHRLMKEHAIAMGWH